jgi:hypothetical protein
VAAQLRRKAHCLAHRHDAAHDDAVDLAVGQRGLIRLEQAVDQKMPTQAFGVERFDVVAVNGLANFHGMPFKKKMPEVSMGWLSERWVTQSVAFLK